MKKLIISLFTTLFLFSPAFAGNIDVLATMQSKSNIQDRVWVGTFQIVWNDFMDKIAHIAIKFPDGTPQVVNELNQQEFTVEDLSENCYYRYFGKIKKNTKKTIAKAIKRKFNETSDLLDQLNLTPDKNKFIVYAMLKKDFEFLKPFDKLGKSNFRDQEAEFFGIDKNSSRELAQAVRILFYNSPSDFAVALDTNDKDEVYLYKTENTKTFNYIYADMLTKEAQYNGDKSFKKNDELKVPNLKFYEEKSFDEVTGKRIKGTNLVIDQAMETIRFEMNNKGVELKSEAGMIATMTALMPEPDPRNFYFDDTFVLFIKEKTKSKPYFALRVYDISNFQ